MAGTIKANTVQLGDSATASQNLVITTNQDGTFKIARGNLGATSQDILKIDALGNLIPVQPGAVIQMQSYLQDNGGSNAAAAWASVTGSYKTITPRSASSILVVEASFFSIIDLKTATNTVGYYSLNENGSLVGDSMTIGIEDGDGYQRLNSQVVLTRRIPNTALAPRSFALSAFSPYLVSVGASQLNFTITEIAA